MLLKRTWRRSWPIVALTAAALAVVIVHLFVDRLTRESPNYSMVEDGLWLGGYVSEPPHGSQAVLNLCETEDPYQVESHRWEPIVDAEPVPSLDWLRAQVAFIESERAASHVVFVHCRNGVSRSGMVMAAYLMRREGWSRDQALGFLRSRRPEVRPNPAFMLLLLEWEHLLASRENASPAANR
jgi:Dual specificity phosphatase, catalytic domain